METKLRENEFEPVDTRRLCPVIKKKHTHELHCDKKSLVRRNHKLRKHETVMIEKNTCANVRNILHSHAFSNLYQGGPRCCRSSL